MIEENWFYHFITIAISTIFNIQISFVYKSILLIAQLGLMVDINKKTLLSNNYSLCYVNIFNCKFGLIQIYYVISRSF